MSSLPLRAKFMMFSTVALIGAAVLGWQGNHAAGKIEEVAKLRNIVTLTKLQMRIDMMHDAIHGNIINAREAKADALPDIQKEMEENIKTADESFTSIDALDLPPQFKQSFVELKTEYTGYTEQAKTVIATFGADMAHRQDVYESDFHPVFQKLADMQEKLQDEVNEYSEHEASAAVSEAETIKKWVIYSALFSLLLNVAQPAFAYLAVFSPQRRLLKIGECLTGSGSSSCEEIPYPNRHDEIGALADMLRSLRASIKARADLADNFERKVKHAVDIVASSATEMEATARAMSVTADDSQKRLAELASGVVGTVQNIQEASTAVGQIYASINEISKQVTQASRVNSNAVSEANQVNGLAETLSAAAAKVNEINGIITAIAGKINLLSLNATIEAARAGEAGKGFAVVASEVKTLANQTANSASEITGHIQSIQQSSSDTLNGVRGINSVIAEISNISSTIASAIEEQGVGTHEIARNMKAASETAGSISANVTHAAELAKSTGDAAGQMLQAAGELSRQAEGLRGEVSGFLQNIRNGGSQAA